jgi:hypothetical protein
MKFLRYDIVPNNVQEIIIQGRKRELEEKE